MFHIRFGRVTHVVGATYLFCCCVVVRFTNILHLLIHSPLGGLMLLSVFSYNRIECFEHSRACPLGRMYPFYLVTWLRVEFMACIHPVHIPGFHRCCCSFPKWLYQFVLLPSRFEYSSCSTSLPSLLLSFFLVTVSFVMYLIKSFAPLSDNVLLICKTFYIFPIPVLWLYGL